MQGGGPEERAVHSNKATKPKRGDNAGRSSREKSSTVGFLSKDQPLFFKGSGDLRFLLLKNIRFLETSCDFLYEIIGIPESGSLPEVLSTRILLYMAAFVVGAISICY